MTQGCWPSNILIYCTKLIPPALCCSTRKICRFPLNKQPIRNLKGNRIRARNRIRKKWPFPVTQPKPGHPRGTAGSLCNTVQYTVRKNNREKIFWDNKKFPRNLNVNKRAVDDKVQLSIGLQWGVKIQYSMLFGSSSSDSSFWYTKSLHFFLF